MRGTLLGFVLIFSAFMVKADIINELSSVQANVLEYTAENPTNINIDLLLRQTDEDPLDSIPLILSIDFNGEVINDYLWVPDSFKGTLKTVFLKKGESFKASLFINSEDSMTLNNIEGNFSTKVAILTFNSADESSFLFTGDLWSDNEVPLFRLEKRDSTRQGIKFIFDINENFEYDKLYVKMKVISPTHGVMNFEKVIEVNSGEYISNNQTVFVIDLEGFNIEKQGNYYFELTQNHVSTRVNGVVSVSYELYPF